MPYREVHAAIPSMQGSLQVWPAAGGGILIGMAEPSLAGSARIRPVIKTIFLTLDDRGGIFLTVPYVTLETEAQVCAATLVADELQVPAAWVDVFDKHDDDQQKIVDLAPSAERALRACGATARFHLVTAAARNWGMPNSRCSSAEGVVVAGRRSANYRQLAQDAARLRLPTETRQEPIGDFHASVARKAK